MGIERRQYGVFLASLAHVEAAKDSIVGAVPAARHPGRPLAEALFGFDEGITNASASMPDWRSPEVEPEWVACEAGLAEAAGRSEALRLQAPDLGFESLLAAVERLLAPLEAFEAAEERFRSLLS